MEARILKIDLSNRSYEIERIPDKIIKQYLGGRGLGAYLSYKLIPARAEPLGEENQLIFSAGPSSGTNFFFSPKANVTTKSPLTDIYLYSISSGSVSHQIRKAGFWAIAIKGIADSLTYIEINNQEVKFKDATSLWGMNPLEAQQAMLGDSSEKKAATMAIGPAGEQLIRYACIFSEGDYYRAFGRGGAGCVMGSKKLKGIIISGDGVTEIADKAKFEAAKKAIMENIQANRQLVRFRRDYGTGGDLDKMNEAGIIPTRNWQGGTFENWAKISTATTSEEWPRKNITCGPYCPAICSHFIELEKGPYKGAHCDGPEYETIYAFGSNCGIDKFDSIVAAAQICDEYGIDTMTAGVTIGFAMECFEKGLIGLKDTDGVELRFGDDEAMIVMLKKMVNQEGFGRRLLAGTKRLSEEIKGSEAFAMHTKGMEYGGYECRGLNGQALQFAISNRGGCHHAYGLPAREELVDGTGMEIEGKGEQLKDLAIGRILRDSFLACSFVGNLLTKPILADAISALFGEPWSEDDLNRVGVRIMCQERLFNMREGITRKDDALPLRLLKEPKPDGPTKGAVVPLEELKDEYYRAMGWDLLSGNPTNALLEELEVER